MPILEAIVEKKAGLSFFYVLLSNVIKVITGMVEHIDERTLYGQLSLEMRDLR